MAKPAWRQLKEDFESSLLGRAVDELLTKDPGFPAFACRLCWKAAKVADRAEWRIDRRGDAVVSWACRLHLADECQHLQRDFETTELVVRWTP